MHPSATKDRRRWSALLILSLSLLLIGLANSAVNVAIPSIQRAFGSEAETLAWIINAYVLVFAGLLLIMGALGDRYGRARALDTGLIIFMLASLWAAFSPNTDQLIAARALMGVGGALIMPATLSIITATFPREQRGKAIAIWAAVAGLGIGLGPLFGGLLLENAGWESVFLLNVPIILFALLAGIAIVPNSKDPNSSPIDWLGGVLSITAITALVFGIIEVPRRGWDDPLVIGAILLALVVGVAFFAWESRTRYPMLPLRFFRNPRFSAAAGAISVMFFALFGSFFVLTQYLQFVRGLTPLQTGLVLVPVAIGIAMGAGTSNRMVQRFGTTRPVAVGMSIVTIILISALLLTVDTPVWVVSVGMFILALGMGNVMAPSTESVMGAVPGAKAGVGSAVNDMTRQIAGALGIAVISSALNSVFRNQMVDVAAGAPEQVRDLVSNSIGTALAVASQAPDAIGAPIAAAAGAAFVDGMGVAFVIGAVIAGLGTVAIARWLPPHHLPEEVREESPLAPGGVAAE